MKNPFIYCLYLHINKTNGMVYVGISTDPEKRWRRGQGYRRNAHFWSAIQKYGWDGFYHLIVRTGLTINEAYELEKRYIYLMRSNQREFGYNKSIGGDSGNKGKDSYSYEYQLTSHRKWQRNHTKYFRDYERTHKDKVNKLHKQWYEKFKKEHGCTYITWRKHQLKNDQL